jgi:MFS family permease
MNAKNYYNKMILYIVLAGIFWTKTASLLSIPFLTLFLYKNTTLSITYIGIIVGFQPLALCFGSIVGGYFSDVFNRHTIILSSVTVSCLVYIGFYLTGKYLTIDHQMVCFALLNLLNGFCSALFSPASRSIISEVAGSAEENIKFLHMRYLALNLGTVVGPLIGGYAGVSGNVQAFLVTAILYFIYTIILLIVLKNDNPLKLTAEEPAAIKFIAALKGLVTNHLFLALLISSMIFNIIYVQLTSNLALIINKNIVNGTLFFSWMLSLNAILVITLQPIIYFIVRNHSQRKIILYGYIIILLSSLTLVNIPIGKLTIIFFVISLTIAEILIFPTGSILVTEITPAEYRGTAFGAIDFEYFGSAIGSAIGGVVIQNFASQRFFSVMLLLSILCIVTYLPCLMQMHNKDTQAK